LNYLKRAVELRARAATTPDEDMQQFWLRLAEEWEFLAELRENTREVGAPPPRRFCATIVNRRLQKLSAV